MRYFLIILLSIVFVHESCAQVDTPSDSLRFQKVYAHGGTLVRFSTNLLDTIAPTSISILNARVGAAYNLMEPTSPLIIGPGLDIKFGLLLDVIQAGAIPNFNLGVAWKDDELIKLGAIATVGYDFHSDFGGGSPNKTHGVFAEFGIVIWGVGLRYGRTTMPNFRGNELHTISILISGF